MEYILRLETSADHRAVEKLTKSAFLPLELPGREVCDEHLLAHKLRKTAAFVPQLDYVAAEVDADGAELEIIGNILYSRAAVVDEAGEETEVLTFGPLSVAPEKQGQGVGAALIRHTAGEAGRLGYRAILIFGHPGYYPRFGFRPAAGYGITAPDGSSPDALMALECRPGGLDGVRGAFHPDPVYFDLTPAELAEFDFHLEEQLDND